MVVVERPRSAPALRGHVRTPASSRYVAHGSASRTRIPQKRTGRWSFRTSALFALAVLTSRCSAVRACHRPPCSARSARRDREVVVLRRRQLCGRQICATALLVTAADAVDVRVERRLRRPSAAGRRSAGLPSPAPAGARRGPPVAAAAWSANGWYGPILYFAHVIRDR